MGTRPARPSIRRASSRIGASPMPGSVIASVTRTIPLSVTNVVSSTLVPGTYRRCTSNGTSGHSSKRPPRSASRRGEDARRVEVRQTQPIDATIARDQRDGATVADHGIVPDRRVATRQIYLAGAERSTARVCRAIIRSSFVGITLTVQTLAGALIVSASLAL